MSPPPRWMYHGQRASSRPRDRRLLSGEDILPRRLADGDHGRMSDLPRDRDGEEALPDLRGATNDVHPVPLPHFLRQVKLLARPDDAPVPGDHPEVEEVVVVEPFHVRKHASVFPTSRAQ